jgi:hypothetical protein
VLTRLKRAELLVNTRNARSYGARTTTEVWTTFSVAGMFILSLLVAQPAFEAQERLLQNTCRSSRSTEIPSGSAR